MSVAEQARAALGTWGKPPDDAAKIALGVAVFFVLIAVTGRGRAVLGYGEHAVSRRLFLWVASLVAALLSIAYIAIYLRGGPRIIDATTYFMQGRALSHGDLSWPTADPSGSFRGRFLLYREDAAGEGTMGGIFPPGYPLLLALGFKIGAPMVVGPLLAVAIVIVTYRLARLLAEDVFTAPETIEAAARTAALVSIFCGALRYHTADTMAHAATALGIAIALGAALRKRPGWAGLALGGLVATRPVSAVAIALVVLVIVARAPFPSRPRAFGRLALGMVPGVFLLLLAQHAVTGHWLASSQKMYYALADGPPDCFRWGFGKGTGCLYEHGDFVESRLQNGYGLVAALGTTLRRLRMHVLDIANFEPLALLVLLPLAKIRGRRSPAALAALAVIPLHVLAYAGFYFDGNYPGGGARFFADLLPIEHALLAIAVLRLVPNARRGAYLLAAVMLGGFAVHAVFGHIQLAERDGGRPMFEPDVLTKANINAGLVFLDTDHGFALGYDETANPKTRVLVARLHNDDRDRLLYDHLDHPPSFIYRFDMNAPATPTSATPPTITPWAPPALADPSRFEAEAEWPPLAQTGGFAVPAMGSTCASATRDLALTPSPLEGRASATISVPVPQAGKYRVTIRVDQGVKVPHTISRIDGKPPKGSATIGDETWTWSDIAGKGCADLPTRDLVLAPPHVNLVLGAEGGTVALDRVMLKRL